MGGVGKRLDELSASVRDVSDSLQALRQTIGIGVTVLLLIFLALTKARR